MSRNDMEGEIVTLLGGRVAEKLVLGDISTGASNDITRATSIARNMVTRYGMSDSLGSIVYGSEHSDGEVFLGRDFSNSRNYSEQTASLIDGEIKRIVDLAYQRAEDILNEKMKKLHFVAEFLYKYEIMDEAQFEAVMNGEPTFEELEEMKSEQRRRSEEENRAKAERDAAEKAAREKEEAEKAEKEGDENNDGDGDDKNDTDMFTFNPFAK